MQTRPAIVQAVRTQSAQERSAHSCFGEDGTGDVDGDRVAVEVGGGNEPRSAAASCSCACGLARSSVMVSQRQTLDATDVADKPERKRATHHLDILVSDLDVVVDHAISLGASMAPAQ